MPFGNTQFILEDLYSSVLSQFKKYHPSGNLKFNNFGIFEGLKLRILMKKILLISLKLNFIPNTLGCHNLMFYIVPYDLLLVSIRDLFLSFCHGVSNVNPPVLRHEESRPTSRVSLEMIWGMLAKKVLHRPRFCPPPVTFVTFQGRPADPLSTSPNPLNRYNARHVRMAAESVALSFSTFCQKIAPEKTVF